MIEGKKSVAPDYEARFAEWRELAATGEFEPALAALEASVTLLESGGLTLAAMTDCYELGLRLSRRCADLLRAAELRISVLDQEFAAEPVSDVPTGNLVQAPVFGEEG